MTSKFREKESTESSEVRLLRKRQTARNISKNERKLVRPQLLNAAYDNVTLQFKRHFPVVERTGTKSNLPENAFSKVVGRFTSLLD